MAKPKEIGQVTWITYPNYGTFLQAYALQYTMNLLGYESRIIDDRRFTNLYVSRRLWLIKILGSFLHPIKNFHWLKSRIKQLAPYRRFKKRYLKIDNSWKEPSTLSKRYKGFICGSDQIWSPLLPEHHDGFYFASFAELNKIAYAPSIGCTTIPENQERQFKEWLSGFKAINMREEAASLEIGRLTGINVQTVLDPTLLLTSDQWLNISTERKVKAPYILGYFLSYNDTYVKYLEQFTAKTGYSLIVLGNDSKLKSLSHEYVENIGPDDFVGLIRRAECIITDSFHGTIFSIILNKPFVTFKRFKNTDPMNQNSRIENLFKLLDINHFYSEVDIENERIEFTRNFNDINDKLAKQRERSISLLKASLEKL